MQKVEQQQQQLLFPQWTSRLEADCPQWSNLALLDHRAGPNSFVFRMMLFENLRAKIGAMLMLIWWRIKEAEAKQQQVELKIPTIGSIEKVCLI